MAEVRRKLKGSFRRLSVRYLTMSVHGLFTVGSRPMKISTAQPAADNLELPRRSDPR